MAGPYHAIEAVVRFYDASVTFERRLNFLLYKWFIGRGLSTSVKKQSSGGVL